MIDRPVSSIAERDMNKKKASAAEKCDELAASHCIPEALPPRKPTEPGPALAPKRRGFPFMLMEKRVCTFLCELLAFC